MLIICPLTCNGDPLIKPLDVEEIWLENNIFMRPLGLSKAAKSRRESEAAVKMSKEATKEFDQYYKKPIECIDVNTRTWEDQVKCSNHYLRARKEFEKQ